MVPRRTCASLGETIGSRMGYAKQQDRHTSLRRQRRILAHPVPIDLRAVDSREKDIFSAEPPYVCSRKFRQ